MRDQSGNENSNCFSALHSDSEGPSESAWKSFDFEVHEKSPEIFKFSEDQPVESRQFQPRNFSIAPFSIDLIIDSQGQTDEDFQNDFEGGAETVPQSLPVTSLKNEKLEITPTTIFSFSASEFRKQSRQPAQGCNCKKSKCLRMHCSCFKTEGFCGPNCSCEGCINQPQFEEARAFVIKKTKEINPLAFEKKFAVGASTRVNLQGCRCSKNNCQKRYCDCYKEGVGCFELCSCVNCRNGKDIKAKESSFRKKIFRKKHRIIISNRPEKIAEGEMTTISYFSHKRLRKLKKDGEQV